MPGTTAGRGYGAAHQALRRAYEPIVAKGEATCAKCDKRIDPDDEWDLGHTDDRTAYTGPEHPLCNRSAGGRRGAAITNARRSHLSIPW